MGRGIVSSAEGENVRRSKGMEGVEMPYNGWKCEKKCTWLIYLCKEHSYFLQYDDIQKM